MPPRFLKAALSGFEPYVPGLQPADGEEWIKLNTNESPLPPSPRVAEAIRAEAGESLRLYPDPRGSRARAAISDAIGVAPDWVTLGNGGDELIAMCFRAFAAAGDTVAFPAPTYPLLEPLAAMHELNVRAHPMNEEWRLPQALVDDPAPLKFVVNPNSPTGTWYSREELEPVVTGAGGVVVLDEAYVDFAPAHQLELVRRHSNLVIVRTFSKAYALAGMRIGYSVANPDLVQSLDTVKDSYNLDRLAIVAAVAAIGDRDHHDRIVTTVVEERDWLSAQLSGLGFVVEPSAANFVFTKPPSRLEAAAVYEGLRARRVLVRHYNRPPVEGWLRITIGTREQLQVLMEGLGEILAEAA
jgi:histidinol-phosphate aminotransferase